MKPSIWLLAILAAALLAALPYGAVIDFEQINMSIPHESMIISNQFEPHYGILFRRTAPGYPFPVIARTGAPQSAFDRRGAVDSDMPADASADLIGSHFLTDTAQGDNDTAADYLVLEFTRPVSRASGYIIDIDGSEIIEVRAYSDTNGANLLTQLTFDATQPNTGDGVATFWQLARATKEIYRVEIRGGGANVGYDLFDSDYPPDVAPSLAYECRVSPGVYIHGETGRRYQIEYADKVETAPGGATWTNWNVLTTDLFLPSANYLFIDTNAPIGSKGFYRVTAP